MIESFPHVFLPYARVSFLASFGPTRCAARPLLANNCRLFGAILSLIAIAGSSQLTDRAAQAQVIEQDVIVNSGSLTNPVGAGFDYWEGLSQLEISLSANPCQIGTAAMFASEDVVWNAIDDSPPDPWVYETAAIWPDEAFAVAFNGTLKCTGGTGGGAAAQWKVAVSDIDIDCDSDNDDTGTNRPPSQSEAEDEVEVAGVNADSDTQGMLMVTGEDWAQLVVNGHVKKNSTYQLQSAAISSTAFDFANSGFSILTPNASGVLDSAALGLGYFERIYYVRPHVNSGSGDSSPTANTGDSATISAVLSAQAPTSGAARARDLVTVSAIRANLEVIDAQAFSPNVDGGIDDSPTEDVNASWDRSGVFADGTSVLVLRLQPMATLEELRSFLLPLTFSVTTTDPTLPQTADYTGSLSTTFPSLPAPDPGSGNLGSTTATISDSDNPLVVYYRPPNNFFYGVSAYTQSLTFTVSKAGRTLARATVNLVRPTIVLNHGFTSNPDNMLSLSNNLYSSGGCVVRLLDWSDINTSGYDTVPLRVFNIVADEVQTQRGLGVAATRLDFFGHSMGGVIVKWYTGNYGNTWQPRRNSFPDLHWLGAYPYLRGNNFGAGDIRRFVSVGPPFQGSPMADAASNVIGYNGWVTLGGSAPGLTGLTGDYCAFDDLGTTSTGTQILSGASPQVSWFPIVGVGAPGRTAADMYGTVFDTIFTILNSDATTLGLLAPNGDFVVRDRSQVNQTAGSFPPGGLNNQVVTSVTHTQEAANYAVYQLTAQALDLLYDPDSPEYVPGYTMFNVGF